MPLSRARDTETHAASETFNANIVAFVCITLVYIGCHIGAPEMGKDMGPVSAALELEKNSPEGAKRLDTVPRQRRTQRCSSNDLGPRISQSMWFGPGLAG